MAKKGAVARDDQQLVAALKKLGRSPYLWPGLVALLNTGASLESVGCVAGLDRRI